MCLAYFAGTGRAELHRGWVELPVHVHVTELIDCVRFCDSCAPGAGPGVGFQESSWWCSGDKYKILE